MSRAGRFLLTAVVLWVAPAGADEVLLRNGGRINGIVVKQTPQAVVIETSPGLVTIPSSRIARVLSSASYLETWRQRSTALQPADARGWAALARWAEEVGLTTQARTAWSRVLVTDPRNAEAHRALGHVEYQGAWMASDEAYQARGFVQVDGRWISPAEHDALLRQQAQDDAARAERAAAELRLREAEAHAREAEAHARAAESGAGETGMVWGGYGFPFPYGYGQATRRRHDGGEHRGTGGSARAGAGGPAQPTPIGGAAGGRPAQPTPIGGGGSTQPFAPPQISRH